jgi:hypothetical protein
MLRTPSIAVCIAAVCSSALAQHRLDASNSYPITVPIQDAGTFDLDTMSWISPQAAGVLNASSLTVYNNTCTWTGAAHYTGTGSCEDYIDEGEIPGPDNANFTGLGATTDNLITSFKFGYCTKFTSPDIKIGFYDTLGGACAGYVLNGFGPSVPLSTNPNLVGYFSLAGQLPGSPGNNQLACWTVTVATGTSAFCLKSEGDGVWDDDVDLDRFNWSFQMDDPQTAAVGGTSGIIESGEPVNAPGGYPGGVDSSCTYNIPCGVDYWAFPAQNCGHGLNTDDGFWVNIDGDPEGDGVNTGVQCFAAQQGGTDCYWFNGYPTHAFASFYLVLNSSGACAGCTGNISSYCPQTAPTVTQGCTSSISSSGIPDIDNPAPFTVTCSGLNAGVNAILFYGLHGPKTTVWSTESSLCVKAPTKRTGVSDTGGTLGQCNGSVSRDMNALLSGLVVAGQMVNVQVWQRDPASSKTTQQSAALQFVMCP